MEKCSTHLLSGFYLLIVSLEHSVPQAVPFPHVKEEERHDESFLPSVKSEENKFILTVLLFSLNNLCLVILMLTSGASPSCIWVGDQQRLNEPLSLCFSRVMFIPPMYAASMAEGPGCYLQSE